MWFIANKLGLNITKTCYMVFKAKCDNNNNNNNNKTAGNAAYVGTHTE